MTSRPFTIAKCHRRFCSHLTIPVIRFALAFLASCSTIGMVAAEDRFALLVGNADYADGGKLTNPERDVDAFGATLVKLGFEVDKVKNVDQEGFDDALNDFEQKLTSGCIAIFFYAGHGFQVDGNNFLLPLEHRVESKRQVRRECISVTGIIEMLEESRCSLRMVILDSCRNNPFERSWSRGNELTGFSAVVPPDGTIVAFATAPGEMASDGKDGNSPFTTALIRAMDAATKRPIEVQRLFRLVGQECARVAKQRPYINADVSMEDFYLGTVGTAVPQRAPEQSQPVAVMDRPADEKKKSLTGLPPVSSIPDVKVDSPTSDAPESDGRMGVNLFSSLLGPVVIQVRPNTPATRCTSLSSPGKVVPLQVGDRIVSVNGGEVKHAIEAILAVKRSPKAMRFVVRRLDGQVLQLTTQLNGEPDYKGRVDYASRPGMSKLVLRDAGIIVEESPQLNGLKIKGVIVDSIASRIQADSLPGVAANKISVSSAVLITHINHYRVKTLAGGDQVLSNEVERLKSEGVPFVMILNIVDRRGREYCCYFTK